MKKCPKCGTVYNDTFEKCPDCDTTLEEHTYVKEATEISLLDLLKENKKKFILCFVIIAVFFLGFAFKALTSISKSDYQQLENQNTELTKQIEDINSEYTSYKKEAEAYKEKMQPYEEQQTADEKARQEQAAAEKAAREQAEAEQKAAAQNAASSSVRDNVIGKSNKNIDNVDSKFSVSDVRNDKTGKWRISTIAANMQIEEYALSYYKKYFTNDSEIHWIVNFTLKTTTSIAIIGNMLEVTIHEYVDSEEHYADTLGGGMVLSEFFVYLDNGDIEQVL